MSVQCRKIKMKLNFLEGKPERFKLVQVNTPAVTFEQLVNECSASCATHEGQTKLVIDSLINRLVHYMEIGHAVKVGDFGLFKPTFRSKTTKSADELSTDTITKKVIRFYPGKRFRNMLTELNIINADNLDNTQETPAETPGE